MNLDPSLRRPAMGLVGLTLLVGGSVGMVSVAGAAPSDEPSRPAGMPIVALHNATAETGTDCPDDDLAYWHFVFAPNNGSASFDTIILNLGDDEPDTFSGAEIVPNGSQTDNVFVAVPAGHTLTDLQVSGSYASYEGTAPNKFNLSHVCEGAVGEETTTTTAPEETTTTTAPVETTTTTAPVETTTTTAPVETTTTTAPVETTTTTAPVETTTTTAPVETTTTTAPEETTTTTAPAVVSPEDTEGPAPQGPAPQGPAPQGPAPAAQPAEAQVLAATATRSGTLPYTGSDTTGLLVSGTAISLGGLVLAGMARAKLRRTA